MPWLNPDCEDEIIFDPSSYPEPFDNDPCPEQPSLVGIPLAYEGAIVIEQENGDFVCEHGRNLTGSPTATARGCTTNCKGGLVEPDPSTLDGALYYMGKSR